MPAGCLSSSPSFSYKERGAPAVRWRLRREAVGGTICSPASSPPQGIHSFTPSLHQTLTPARRHTDRYREVTDSDTIGTDKRHSFIVLCFPLRVFPPSLLFLFPSPLGPPLSEEFRNLFLCLFFWTSLHLFSFCLGGWSWSPRRIQKHSGGPTAGEWEG